MSNKIYTNKEFVNILRNITENEPTQYNNKFPYNCGYWDGTKFTFDCWNLIKSVLGGWVPNKTVGYYVSPKSFPTGDCTGAQLLAKCEFKSKDFSKISYPGTYLYMSSSPHSGTYIGDTNINGQIVNVVECTGSWERKVLYSYVDSNGGRWKFKGDKKRNGSWSDWGLLPYIDYVEQPQPVQPVPTPQPTPQPTSYKNDKYVWDKLKAVIGNDYGVSGLMGNLYAESGIRSNNLQNSYEKKFGLTDEQYTQQVDNGTISREQFSRDSAGMGIAQWTYWSRKQNLYDFAKQQKASIGSLAMQVDFLIQELSTSYKGVLNALKTATSVKQASDVVLTQYERPRDQTDKVKEQRASYSLDFYNKYAGATPTPVKPAEPEKTEVVYTVRAGDTLSAIARKYNTTYQKIAKDNNIPNPNIIYIGQKLVIK